MTVWLTIVAVGLVSYTLRARDQFETPLWQLQSAIERSQATFDLVGGPDLGRQFGDEAGKDGALEDHEPGRREEAATSSSSKKFQPMPASTTMP